MERPLDPGYATAAARRAQGVRPTRRGLVLTLLLALVCGALATRSILELRRPQPGADQARAALQAQVRERTAALDSQQEQLDRLRAEVATLRARALTGAGGAHLAEQNSLLELLAGETPVTGPGLRITMADAPSTSAGSGTDPRQGTTADQGRVLDRDLQTVVNGLWAAGAEAVAVNGQRLDRAVGDPVRRAGHPGGLPAAGPAVRRAGRRRRRRPADPVRGGRGRRLPAGSARQLRGPGGYRSVHEPRAPGGRRITDAVRLRGRRCTSRTRRHAWFPGASASPSASPLPSAVPSTGQSQGAGTVPPTSEVSP